MDVSFSMGLGLKIKKSEVGRPRFEDVWLPSSSSNYKHFPDRKVIFRMKNNYL
jgi:hypothetical protein